MNTSKIIKGVVSSGRYTVTAPIVKEDYGLYLQIEGLELPETYQVDFSTDEHSGSSVTMIGNSDGVLIPRQFIDTGKDVFAFLYHVGEDFGRTVYKFRIPNKVRPDRTEEQPTPEEQSTIDQLIGAMNTAVAQTTQDKADADASAQSASEYAEQAEISASTAQNYANASETYANTAEVHADRASASATASAQSAQSAEQSAQTASAKADAITGLTATATTLPDGSSATASYNPETGVMSFGIPKGKDGTNGIDGDDGYSPIANVSKTGKTATITITDKNGTTSAQVEDGTDGTDGISPTVTITPITGGHRITITDADGEHSADVMDGTGNVDDVQINGTSIVQDGVANVPKASTSTLGTVRTSGTYGTQMYGSNADILGIILANDNDTKAGNSGYRALTAQQQHRATFYGLAKAAGDATQSASSNAVGTYTEDARGKIHDMLGIGTARALMDYAPIGSDTDLIQIVLPDRYEKVWLRFRSRINNANNDLANATVYYYAWLGDSPTFDATAQNSSVYVKAFIRQTDKYLQRIWFVVDFPFLERFGASMENTTFRTIAPVNNYGANVTDASQVLTSYPKYLFIRPVDTTLGYLFKADSELGVYVK